MLRNSIAAARKTLSRSVDTKPFPRDKGWWIIFLVYFVLCFIIFTVIAKNLLAGMEGNQLIAWGCVYFISLAWAGKRAARTADNFVTERDGVSRVRDKGNHHA